LTIPKHIVTAEDSELLRERCITPSYPKHLNYFILDTSHFYCSLICHALPDLRILRRIFLSIT